MSHAQASAERSETTYGRGLWGVQRRVFWPALVIALVVSFLAIAFPAAAEETIGALQSNVIGAFGWYYVLLVAGFVAFALWVGLGRWGELCCWPAGWWPCRRQPSSSPCPSRW